MHFRQIAAPIFALSLLCSGLAVAQSSEEEELALVYGDKSFVSIATGARVPIARAPAIATVITAEDIQALGAIDLDDVLEAVPGLHVARSPITYTPIYTFRGIRGTITNPQVLMLINGIPMTAVLAGDRGVQWGGLPLENVARIEVIRGPGSALYGADAFAGVINIITKTAAEIGGTPVGARVGSFKTWDVWALHGSKWGGLEVAAYLRLGSTDGAKQTISADAQTGWDTIFGTSASRAPGPLNLARDAVDGTLDVAYDKWRLRAGYKLRNHLGSGAGVAQALDPAGDNYSARLTSDLSYQNRDLARGWDIMLQASYLHYKEKSELVLFPPGAFGGLFPEGLIGNPSKWERNGRVTASASYEGFRDHRVRLGAGYIKQDLYRIRESKNFTQEPGLANLGAVVDVSDTNPFIRPHTRHVRFAYVQDEWTFAKDWALTAGARHDRYSDFGGTTNPRLALVWEAAYNITAKLLYGSAFRAPAFVELYNINNPVNLGNPALQPEKIRTVEAALSWQPTARVHLGANVFRYRMSDMIRLVATTHQNSGSQTGTGLELEGVWDAARDVRLSGSYSRQRAIDKATDQDAGLAPHHRGYLRGDWRFLPGWNANLQVNRVADRRREPGDTRPAVADYTTLDLAVRTAGQRKDWDATFIVRNLSDANVMEPSPSGTPFTQIPNDLPLPGRAYYVQGSYRF